MILHQAHQPWGERHRGRLLIYHAGWLIKLHSWCHETESPNKAARINFPCFSLQRHGTMCWFFLSKVPAFCCTLTDEAITRCQLQVQIWCTILTSRPCVLSITLSSKRNKSWLFWCAAVRTLLVIHIKFFFFFPPSDHFWLLVLCSGKYHNYPVCNEAEGRICP